MRALLVLAVALVAAAPAGAAQVRVESLCEERGGCTRTVVYVADAGEANVLEATAAGPGALRLRDTGASEIRPGGGCRTEDAQTVVCAAHPSETLRLTVRLRDGDDRATVPGGTVEAGAGDDSVTSSDAATLTGGPGRDVLTGSDRGDEFVDRDGRTPAPDRYLGAGGWDSVSYSGRRRGLRIDLRRERAGEDVIDSIQRATAGRGDDRLYGTARAESLSGGPGDDLVEARGGDDQIFPEAGADVVRAGAGDDRITLPRGSRGTGDRIGCGSGRDVVDGTGAGDLLLPGCERFAFGSSQAIDNFPRYFPDGAAAVVADLRDCCAGAARTSAVLSSGGAVLDAVPRGRRAAIKLRLGAAGWAALRRHGRLRVQITLRFGAPLHERHGVRLELRLR